MEESNIETHNTIKLSPRFTLHPAKTRRNGSHADFRFSILIFGELAPIPRCLSVPVTIDLTPGASVTISSGGVSRVLIGVVHQAHGVTSVAHGARSVPPKYGRSKEKVAGVLLACAGCT